MKEKNIFDILENAENDSMERLIEKCPEISDEQLDRIFAKSEKKFIKMRAEENGTKRDKNIKMTENDTVEGVEHSRRPAWLAPLSTAASILLIAGIAIGSTVMLKRNNKPSGGGGVAPAVTVTSSTGTGTNIVSTDKNGSTIKVTTVTTASSADTATVTNTDAANDENTDTSFIDRFVGTWKYQESSVNDLSDQNSIETKGTVQINSDATYTYTDNNGRVTTGKITEFIEEIGGTEIPRLDFSGNNFKVNGAYYVESKPYELHFGNGYAARLLRSEYEDTHGVASSYDIAYRFVLKDFMNSNQYNSDSRWDLQDLDGDGTPELLISANTNYGSYIYYFEDGSAHIVGNIVVENFGRNGTFLLCKDENLIGFSEGTYKEYFSDSFSAFIGKFKDHYVQHVQQMGKFAYPEDPQKYYYDVDNEYVSEEEYNAAVNNFNSKNWTEVGRRYSFGDYSPLN